MRNYKFLFFSRGKKLKLLTSLSVFICVRECFAFLLWVPNCWLFDKALVLALACAVCSHSQSKYYHHCHLFKVAFFIFFFLARKKNFEILYTTKLLALLQALVSRWLGGL